MTKGSHLLFEFERLHLEFYLSAKPSVLRSLEANKLSKMKSLKLMAIILTGMWLSACAQMVSQTPVKPEKENPIENRSESRTIPTEPAASAQQESREKSQTGLTASQQATGAEPEKSADHKTEKHPTSADAADIRLEEARQNLQTSRETESRIAAELERLKKSGSASPEAIKDYEEYLARVRAMTTENQRMVAQMEAAYTRHSTANVSSKSAASNNRDRMFDPNIPEERTVDEVASLDRELNESLAKFDDRLLKEMDAIRAGSAKKLQDLAQEAAEATKRLRDKGVDVDTSGEKSSGKTESQRDAPQTDRETDTAQGGTETQTATRDESPGGGKGAAAQDRHRADYEDDDIVARQLREAAENESDPELKEKLWKEYEEYKKSK